VHAHLHTWLLTAVKPANRGFLTIPENDLTNHAMMRVVSTLTMMPLPMRLACGGLVTKNKETPYHR
jgi:hypothetical protein